MALFRTKHQWKVPAADHTSDDYFTASYLHPPAPPFGLSFPLCLCHLKSLTPDLITESRIRWLEPLTSRSWVTVRNKHPTSHRPAWRYSDSELRPNLKRFSSNLKYSYYPNTMRGSYLGLHLLFLFDCLLSVLLIQQKINFYEKLKRSFYEKLKSSLENVDDYTVCGYSLSGEYLVYWAQKTPLPHSQSV